MHTIFQNTHDVIEKKHTSESKKCLSTVPVGDCLQQGMVGGSLSFCFYFQIIRARILREGIKFDHRRSVRVLSKQRAQLYDFTRFLVSFETCKSKGCFR